ncbi:hypothetical protein ACHQM5_013808 [Ranunculus cassubicifolius]
MGVSIKGGLIGNGNGNGAKQLICRKRRNDEEMGNYLPPAKCSRRNGNEDEPAAAGGEFVPKVSKVCHFWAQGKYCRYGDKGCRFLHKWVASGDLSLMKQLKEDSPVTGIAHLPSVDGFSHKLVSATKDGCLKIWDYGCGAGDCSSFSTRLGVQVTSMESLDPWVFLGIPNAVVVWNAKTNAHLTLPAAPVGLVYALAARDDWLMAGQQDGSISTWRFPSNEDDNVFQPSGVLKGHSLPVISLSLGDKFLYSGSMDNTVRVWELETQLCVFTLTGHTAAVTSLICWEHYLLSASLDATVKVWGRDSSGLNLELVYTHTLTHGVIAFDGYHDSSGKPMLMCSCNDNSLCLYNLPSFKERGKIFCKEEIRAVGACSEPGCIFTGDGAGELRLWKCPMLEAPPKISSSKK